MQQSVFDPDAFLMAARTKAALSTEYPSIPPGEYRACVINEDKFKLSVRQNPKKDGSGMVTTLDVFWRIDAPGNSGADGRVVRQSIFLDLDENGNLDDSPEKNIQLGRLFDAVGLNEPGVEKGIIDLEGHIAVIKVETVADKTDPAKKYNNVKSVARTPL